MLIANAYDRRVTAKGLSLHESEQLRQILSDIVREDFGGVQAAAAKALKVTPTTISDVLSNKRGAGVKLQRAMARFRPQVHAVVMQQQAPAPSGAENNRDMAVRALISVGYDPDEVHRAAAELRAVDPGDRPGTWWLHSIADEIKRERRMRGVE